ncbi:hypothetical protein SAMN02910447_01069 [Ruminococcus sp. YE71]|uniref:hypothetical protein n=1 Tax=unclassified Ruminococcus TaxID=2608920 RepID=UPI000885FDFD|nr:MULTISPECIES: hypothetical protein [unclassified Ruminococcus]SDA16085.1 hypothetical protein SAMN02910446_01068 [Ruminococcus sp. YE78]SFW23898.1 hypothetical protein SAMN02910447_01069 [Ruminococcus sp. YE71]
MKVLQLIATGDYMEFLLSDERAVRVPGKLVEGGFVGKMNANWLLVSGLTYYYKPIGIQDIQGRVREEEKPQIIGAVSAYLRENSSGVSVTFE